MTDAWTGRKYKAGDGGKVEILSEPFVAKDSRQWIAFQNRYIVGVAALDAFSEKNRIIDPKYAVGDKVTNGYDNFTIDAVSSKADEDGDFAYLVIDANGDVDICWENSIESKVSE